MASRKPRRFRTKREEDEFFARVEYVQAAAERLELEEKLHSAKVKNKALKIEYLRKLCVVIAEVGRRKAQAEALENMIRAKLDEGTESESSTSE